MNDVIEAWDRWLAPKEPIVLHEGDSYEVLRTMAACGSKVHSVVCDPPYGLTSIVKRFGAEGAAPAKPGTDGAFARQSRGFMGKTWDGTAVERDPVFWRLVYDVMLPGAYIVAFSSSRTYHHMAVAMEQAGFITHPMIGWTFASGFPKAHNAARAIDQALGVKGGVGGPRTVAHAGWIERGALRGGEGHDGYQRPWMDDPEQVDKNAREYLPGSPEAQEWEGWHYGGQVRKPALEPIYVGQKPFSEKNGALNILKHGVGAVNIDGCRVPAEGRPLRVGDYKDTENNTYAGRMDGSLAGGSKAEGTTDLGRWPANLIHDGSPEVVALFPNSKGQQADASTSAPSARTKNVYGAMRRDGEATAEKRYTENGNTNFAMKPGMRRGDTEGSSARFFESYPFEDRPIFHYPKASKKDRAGSRHPTVKPIALMRALIRHVTPPGGVVLDPFAGSGTTGQAAREEGMNAVLIEREAEYAADIRRRLGLADVSKPESVPTVEDLLG